LEKVYENALAHRLRKLGLEVKQQYSLKVYDEDGTLIGDYSADLFVDNRLISEALAAGRWGEEDFQRHAQPLCAFALQVRSWRFRRSVLEDFGRRPYGLEPREPGRQLEQQREQLPVGQPEQEQPGQQEQQPGVPRGPSSGQGRMASRN
jgi:hypothetical protein